VRATPWLFALAVTSSTWAHAESHSAPSLHWTRGPGASQCIDPSSLAERVEQLTGPVIARPTGARRIIEGHIEHLTTGGYRARFTVASGDGLPAGERTVEHASEGCRGFDATLSFVVAMLIDPELSLEALPPALLALVSGEVAASELLAREVTASPAATKDVLTEQVAPEPSAVAPAANTQDTPASQRSARELSLELFGLAEFSVMPEALVGVGLHVVYEATRHWQFLAGVRGAFSVGMMELDAPLFTGARAAALDALAAACVGTEPEPALRLRVCLAAEYSAWVIRAPGFAVARAPVLSGFGVSLPLELRYRLSAAFSLVALGAVRVNTLSRSFTYDQQVVAHQIPRASFVAGLGPSYSF